MVGKHVRSDGGDKSCSYREGEREKLREGEGERIAYAAGLLCLTSSSAGDHLRHSPVMPLLYPVGLPGVMQLREKALVPTAIGGPPHLTS